ncbi:hypothetical protein KM043_010807 [Ampulex compressa]|nr:hypothetical protein KM043_010807 [Ampulex compressa]
MGFGAVILDSVIFLIATNIALRSIAVCDVCLPYSVILTVFLLCSLYLSYCQDTDEGEKMPVWIERSLFALVLLPGGQGDRSGSFPRRKKR